MDSLWHAYPHTLINASGSDVGLPDGQMGNSEVGHLTIGSGRIIHQELVRISNIVKNNQEGLVNELKEMANSLKKKDSTLHIMGLCSDGGVHSHIDHLLGLIKWASENKIKKIVLTRPAVEAGERLGYLPGDLSQKIDPYLVPLFDSLEYFFGNETLQYLIEKRNIEIVPLAYMRGRTLNDACIILDEAQNATMSQIKMFLTRLGENSKMIITGDETQIDLNNRAISGLRKTR